MSEERYRKEAEFHDRAFSGDVRGGAATFYAVRQSRRRHVLDYLSEHARAARILDYGCGPSSHVLSAEPSGAVVGIDISPVAISQYLENVRDRGLARFSACVMNAERLAFPDASFDLVVGGAILHHLDLEPCFSEIARVLTPGGSAIFIEPLGHNPLINLYRKLTPSMRTSDEHPLRTNDFALARRYFDGVDLTYYNFTSLLAIPLQRLRCFGWLLRNLEGLDQHLFRRFPALGKHAWTVVITLSRPRRT
jgi:SAM-dependent methyltransferase